LSVSASIGTACTITTTALAFNAYDAVGANASTDLDAEGVVTSTCSIGSSGNIKMGQGLNPGDDSSDAIPLRRMVAGSDATSFLNYSVFSDIGMTAVWENATGVAYTGSGISQDLVVYGSVPAAQTGAVVGSYTDTLVVAINY
jgi:spore coat protein U-like protein